VRPGQTRPNEFELAVLERIAEDAPWLMGPFDSLHVLSREFTGVGCFTRFVCDAAGDGEARQPGLGTLIRMPGVPNGMGAVLLCKGASPECLEVFTFGDDHWDGVYDGFSFDRTAQPRAAADPAPPRR